MYCDKQHPFWKRLQSTIVITVYDTSLLDINIDTGIR